MRKKRITNKDFFNLVVEMLQEHDMYPNIIYYHLPSSTVSDIWDYQFNYSFDLNYGGNEGIYLRIYIQGALGQGKETITLPLGSFKTLDTSSEAIQTMGLVAANFVFHANNYVNEHLDDFTWKGWETYFNDEQNKCKLSFSCASYESAMSNIEKYKDKYYQSMVRNNETRETKLVS